MWNLTRRWLLSAFGATATLGITRTAQAATAPFQIPADFPYEIVTVTGDTALAEWTRLRTAGRGYPVVVGGDEDMDAFTYPFTTDGKDTHQDPAVILAAADKIQFPQDLAKLEDAYSDEEMALAVGEWPEDAQPLAPALTVATDILTGKPLTKVYIVLIPTEKSWEVPAYLHYGGWNACPPPAYHVAALRSWYDRFGAELVGLGGDVMNLKVARPPISRDQAMAVASEQYRYCADIVDQGVGDISTLAATLMNAGWWFFWWD